MRDHPEYPLRASYHTCMTQASYKQSRRRKLASNPARKARTLAERRADFESQMREFAARDGIVALTKVTEVSKRIKRLRKRSGLKQYEVAAKINVAPRTYQSWENGEVETSKANYAKIGKALGASANWILFGQEEEPPPLDLKPAEVPVDLAAHEEAANQRHSEAMTELAELRLLVEDLRKQMPQGGQRAAGG